MKNLLIATECAPPEAKILALFNRFLKNFTVKTKHFSEVLQVIHKKNRLRRILLLSRDKCAYLPTYPLPLSDKFVIIGFGYLPTPDYYVINERSLTSLVVMVNSNGGLIQ